MKAIAAAFSPLSAAPLAPVSHIADDARSDATPRTAKPGHAPFAGVLADRLKSKAATAANPKPSPGHSLASKAARSDRSGDAPSLDRSTTDTTDTTDTTGTTDTTDTTRTSTRDRDATAALRAMLEQVADASATDSPEVSSNNAASSSALSALDLPAQATLAGRSIALGDSDSAPTPSSSTKESDDSQEAAPSDGLAARAATDSLRRAAELNPGLIVRDTQAIDPELKAKVDRVVARMKAETGHEVTIAESWRSQTRQNALHAQGRTETGPVVTWTRHSLHTEGAAVDVMIDGKFDNAAAYQQLQTIANEEGLHTLGARDPGHLELVSSKGLTQLAPGVSLTGAAMGSAASAVAAPASSSVVAAVAEVAAVAIVAPVARTAQLAGTMRAAAVSDDSTPADTRRPVRAARAARQSGVLDAMNAAAGTNRRDSGDVRLAIDSTSRFNGATGLAVPTAARAVDAGARVAQVFGLQDAKAAQPMSSLLLRLDNGAGGEDRIRVDLRGTTVGASIDMRDADAAQQLAKNLPDLTRSLESRGLDTGALRVRAFAAAGLHEEGVMRLATVNTESGRTRADTLSTASGSSTKPSRDDAQQDGPKHQPFRQRSRREHKGDTQ